MKLYDTASMTPADCDPYPFKKSRPIPGCTSARTLSRHFWDAKIMRSLQCVVENAARLSSTPSSVLQNGKKLLTSGSSGVVSSSNTQYGFPLILKTSGTRSGKKDLWNEYFVGITTNKLRPLTPCFEFVYAHYSSTLAVENITGRTLYEWIATDSISTRQFLGVFAQLLLSLEVAQRECGFTHFDLHVKNILVRDHQPDQPVVSIDGYTFDADCLSPCIVDFGNSAVAARLDGFLGRGCFPEHGMYPFLVAGADIFKLMTTLLANLKYLGTNSRIRHFITYCIQEFYGSAALHEFPYRVLDCPKELFDSFYNCTTTTIAYHTPRMLMMFLHKNKSTVCRILGITNYPWTRRAAVATATTTDNDACLRSLFCIDMPTVTVPRTTPPPPPPSEMDPDFLVSKKNIPVMIHENRSAIVSYLEPEDKWRRLLMATTAPPRVARIQRAYATLSAYLVWLDTPAAKRCS